MSDYKERMKEELEQLDERIVKLEAFLGGETYEALERTDKFLLNEQAFYMRNYKRFLGERIERANKKEKTDGVSSSEHSTS